MLTRFAAVLSRLSTALRESGSRSGRTGAGSFSAVAFLKASTEGAPLCNRHSRVLGAERELVHRTKALWAVAFYPLLLVAPASAQAGVNFSDHVVTTQAPPSTGCVVPTAATSFLTTDNTVYLFFEATISTGDSLTSNWLAPDGTVIPGIDWASDSGAFCFPGASLSIGNLPESQLGSWQARVYDNGNLLFTISFTVTGFSNQVVTTQAPPATGCVRPTAATSFATTDNTVYLYFEATISNSDSLSSNWLAPDGTVVPGIKWAQNSGNFCFPGASLSVGSLAASQLGSWQARVYDNGRPFFSVPFTVTGSQTTGPAITVTNDASFTTQISPGSLVALMGNGNVLATTTSSGWNPPLPTSANGTSVTMNGILCPLIYVSPSQINLQAPMELQPGTATVVVSNNGQSFSTTVQVLTAAPGIFTLDYYVYGGLASLQDASTSTALTANYPAVPGENVTMGFTGIGPVTNSPGTGNAAPDSPSLSQATSTVSLTVNGITVLPSFTGLIPGLVGYGQVNFQLPANTPAGSSVPVVLTVNGVSSRTAHISVNAAPAPLSSIALTPANATVQPGASLQLTATGSYGDDSTQDLTSVVSWSSSNIGVAAVSASGTVTGVTAGSVAITAASGSVTGTTGLTVGSSTQGTAATVYQTGFEPPTFIPGTINGQDSWSAFVAPASPEVETTTVKTGVQAVAITPVPSTSGVLGAGRSQTYSAANQILTFSIDANLSAAGTPSFWTVLNTSYNNSSPNIGINIDQSGQIHIFIMGTDNPTGVSITRGVWNHYELDVNFINDTVGAFYNGAPVLQGTSFSSTGTALMGYQFYAQGGSPFVGTDTGYFDNLSVTASANNPAPIVVSVAITPSNSTVAVGATLQLTAAGSYSDGSTRNLTNSVSWSSSNAGIATVNAGLVSGVKAGSATISANSGTVTGTTGVTVGAATSAPTLTITTTGAGSGTVSASPSGTSCGSGCLSFATGTVVTLTAAPNTGSTFGGWSGTCSGTGRCTVTMNSSRAVGAAFNATATPVPEITSLSPPAANPLQLLIITGAGFTSDAMVNFSFANGQSTSRSMSVAPVSVSPTSISVSVPPLYSSSGSPVTGTEGVSVQQASGTSNTINVVIAALQSAPASTPGTLTLGFLEGIAAYIGTAQKSIAGTSYNTAQIQEDLAGQLASTNQIIDLLGPVVSGYSASASIGTYNGSPATITAADLSIIDRTLLGSISAIASLPASAAPASGPSFRAAASAEVPDIQQAAANLVSVGTSTATQEQDAAAAAALFAQMANEVDANFKAALAIVSGAAIVCSAVALAAPVAAPYAVPIILSAIAAANLYATQVVQKLPEISISITQGVSQGGDADLIDTGNTAASSVIGAVSPLGGQLYTYGAWFLQNWHDDYDLLCPPANGCPWSAPPTPPAPTMNPPPPVTLNPSPTTYAGNVGLTILASSPLPSESPLVNCTPNPYTITTTASGGAQFVSNVSLQDPGPFAGTLYLGQLTSTITTPALTCYDLQGDPVTGAGTSINTTTPPATSTITGTVNSDMSVTFLSSSLCGTSSTCSMSGVVTSAPAGATVYLRVITTYTANGATVIETIIFTMTNLTN